MPLLVALPLRNNLELECYFVHNTLGFLHQYKQVIILLDSRLESKASRTICSFLLDQDYNLMVLFPSIWPILSSLLLHLCNCH